MSLRKFASLFKNDTKQWQTIDRDSHFNGGWQKDSERLKKREKNPVGDMRNEGLFPSHSFSFYIFSYTCQYIPFPNFQNTKAPYKTGALSFKISDSNYYFAFKQKHFDWIKQSL